MAVSSLKKELSKRFGFKVNILIALAAFWVNFCLLGVLRSNAVIYRALVDVFHVKREDAAWPSGIFGFFMCVTGALSGFLTRYISVRNLAVIGAFLASVSVSTCSLASEMKHIVYLYGALQGIGVGIIVPLTHVVLNRSFTKYRAFALGIAYSGSSLGSLVFPPVTNALLYTYGLDGTFLLLGSIMLNSLIGTILFNSSNPEKEDENKQHIINYAQCAIVCENPNKQNDSSIVQNSFIKYESGWVNEGRLYEKQKHFHTARSLTVQPDADTEERGNMDDTKGCCKLMPSFKMAIEILSSPHFLIVSTAYAVYFSTSAIFLMVVVDFVKDRNVDLEDGVYLVSAFSAGDFAGRLSFGWIADTNYVKRNVLVRIYLLSMGLLTACLPICPMPTLPVFSIFLGVLNGSVIVNHSVLLNEYLGLEKLPLAIGFSTCIVGMTAFIRPIIIGLFRDRHESYDHLFVFVGLLQVSITVIWFAGTLGKIIKRRCFENKIVE